MPTYEYTCRDCGHTFEVVQSMWDEALTMCPECGGSLRKVFAPPAISFKGSGFYATDHGKKSKKTDAESKESKESRESKDAKGAKETTSASKDGAAAKETSSASAKDTGPSKPSKKEPAPS
jgi:putative FmdB family regulatory protein